MTAHSEAKPLYVHRSTVWFDELDMVGVLHNARYAIHVERAMTSWYHSIPDPDPSDSVVVVRQYDIEFLRPFTKERGEIVVECGLGRLGTTSAVYTFRVLSYDGDRDGDGGSGDGDGRGTGEGTEIEHAHGIRAIVKVDPQTLRPVPWSARFREVLA